MAARAPRFTADFERFGEWPGLVVPRESWDAAKRLPGDAIEIDITQTPLAGVAKDCWVYGSELIPTSSTSTMALNVYRHPEGDPAAANVDRYSVYEELPEDTITYIVQAASTEYDPNLRSFLEGHVFIVKEAPDGGHWPQQLPPFVRGRIEK